MICKIGVPKSFAIFTGKHMLESIFNKVAGSKTCNVIKTRLHAGVLFPENIAKF